MQMLAAGGVPCLGEWPGFEDLATVRQLRKHPRLWIPGAVKVLRPTLTAQWVRRSPATDWIWVQRDVGQTALSQDKFARMILGFGFDGTMDRLRHEIEAEQATFPALMAHSPHRLLVVHFERILSSPSVAALRLCRFLGLPDAAHVAMASEVRPRGSECYDGLLEADLLAAEPAR